MCLQGRVFQWQEDINVVVISAISSTKPCLSIWDFNFQPRNIAKRSSCPWNQPHILRKSDESLLSPDKSETQFCRRKTAEGDNVRINVSPKKHCTFLLFKGSAFPQIFFPIKWKFWGRHFFLIVNVWYTYLLL